MIKQDLYLDKITLETLWIMNWKWARVDVYCSIIYNCKKQKIPRGLVIIIIMDAHISKFIDGKKKSQFLRKTVCVSAHGRRMFTKMRVELVDPALPMI